jgi:hypothetical protein
MLFHKKTKKALKYVSIVIGIFIIISMIMLYAPILPGAGGSHTPPPAGY